MKWVANLFIGVLFAVIIAQAPGIIRDTKADQRAKADLAEIHHIVYGIFSVNAWKSKISEIMIAEIQKLDLKSATLKLKTTIESQLSAVIDKLNEQVREANKSSLGGKIKQVLIDLVVDIEVVKKGVPGYADTLIAQLGTPENEKVIKDLATKEMRAYLGRTFTEQDLRPVNEILKRVDATSVREASEKLYDQIEARRPGLELRSGLVIVLAVLLFVLSAIWRNRSRFSVILLFATLVTLLVLGVSTPMIDLEAKIAEMSFTLIGHKIAFENQILYFQSKSILDVFLLMITHPDAKMKLVGVLLVLFSLVIPITKLASSLIIFFFETARNNSVLRFMAFKTGKWSMADVMVAAIMMAYIGFNGIVETQFGKMKALVPQGVTFITTNGTSLQMGFYFFVTYAVLGLFFTKYIDHAVQPVAAGNLVKQGGGI